MLFLQSSNYILKCERTVYKKGGRNMATLEEIRAQLNGLKDQVKNFLNDQEKTSHEN